jgi:hypothetical protein
MKRINLDAQADAVKQFFLSLPLDAEGSVLELNGRQVAQLHPVRQSAADDRSKEDDWTQAKNTRRCHLIDKEIAETLTADEASELHDLQQQMLRYRRSVAPLPLDDARKLHQELLARARQGNGQQHP